MAKSVLISKKELRIAFGLESYQGLYSLLSRFGITLKKGKQLITPLEISEICAKTGIVINK